MNGTDDEALKPKIRIGLLHDAYVGGELANKKIREHPAGYWNEPRYSLRTPNGNFYARRTVTRGNGHLCEITEGVGHCNCYLRGDGERSESALYHLPEVRLPTGYRERGHHCSMRSGELQDPESLEKRLKEIREQLDITPDSIVTIIELDFPLDAARKNCKQAFHKTASTESIRDFVMFAEDSKFDEDHDDSKRMDFGAL